MSTVPKNSSAVEIYCAAILSTRLYFTTQNRSNDVNVMHKGAFPYAEGTADFFGNDDTAEVVHPADDTLALHGHVENIGSQLREHQPFIIRIPQTLIQAVYIYRVCIGIDANTGS